MAQPRILVVDDDKGFASVLQRVLTRAGYQVQLEQDGLDALVVAFSESFDGILLDIMVPRIDGLSLLGYLRGSGIETPVVVISARDGVGDRAAALRAGADDYLVKPFAMTELLTRVDRVVRAGRDR